MPGVHTDTKKLEGPTACATDKNRTVYVADYNGVHMFESSGKCIRSWYDDHFSKAYEAVSMSVSNSGLIYISHAGVVRCYHSDGTSVQEWNIPPHVVPDRGWLHGHILTTYERMVYVGHLDGGDINEYNSNGTSVRTLKGHSGSISAMAMGPNRILYVVDLLHDCIVLMRL